MRGVTIVNPLSSWSLVIDPTKFPFTSVGCILALGVDIVLYSKLTALILIPTVVALTNKVSVDAVLLTNVAVNPLIAQSVICTVIGCASEVPQYVDWIV